MPVGAALPAHDGFFNSIHQELEALKKGLQTLPEEHRGVRTQLQRLERAVVETAALEQQRIGRDLHDTVGQELTALTMLVSDLAEAIQTQSSTASTLAARIAQGLQRCHVGLRRVLHGLLPVTIEPDALMAALAALADRTRDETRVDCTFECPQPVRVADNLIATNLYLIAQEAVHNAVKHSRPQKILINLLSDGDLVLRVQCDGDCLAPEAMEKPGLGVRTMRYRAGLIGGTLTIESAQPTGTVVTCTVARSDHDQE